MNPKLWKRMNWENLDEIEFLRLIKKGGPGSGHHGHAGRPGQRGGSLPREESEGKVTIYHGTSHDRMMRILSEGIQSGKYQNFESIAYEGERGRVVFVSTMFQTAAVFGTIAEEKSGKAAVVVEAKIPTSFFNKNAKRDEKALGGEAWTLPEVRPEWITNVYDTEGNVATKTIDSLTGLKFKEKKEETITVYIPMAEEVLKKIDEEETKRNDTGRES